jgi:hypothetical protein
MPTPPMPTPPISPVSPTYSESPQLSPVSPTYSEPPQSPPQSPTYAPEVITISDSPVPPVPAMPYRFGIDDWKRDWGKDLKQRKGTRRLYYCPALNVDPVDYPQGCWMMGKLGQVLTHVNKEKHGVGRRMYSDKDQELLKKEPEFHSQRRS